MYGNSRFRQASKAETPQFAAAAGRQGQLDNAAQMQENSQLSNNVMGAGALYNEGMGDKSPLYDLMAEAFGPEETVTALRSGADIAAEMGGDLSVIPSTAALTLDPNVQQALTPEVMEAMKAMGLGV